MTAQRKVQIEPGYPLPGFPHTTDPERCPGCGSVKISLVDAVFTSGQRIGVCKNCAANYIVEPAAPTALQEALRALDRINQIASFRPYADDSISRIRDIARAAIAKTTGGAT